MNRIKVQVLGHTNTGKTTILKIIQDALNREGIKVSIDCDSSPFFLQNEERQKERINIIKDQLEVVIEEVNLHVNNGRYR